MGAGAVNRDKAEGMVIERLTECIGLAVRRTEFINVFRQRFDSSMVHDFCTEKPGRVPSARSGRHKCS